MLWVVVRVGVVVVWGVVRGIDARYVVDWVLFVSLFVCPAG